MGRQAVGGRDCSGLWEATPVSSASYAALVLLAEVCLVGVFGPGVADLEDLRLAGGRPVGGFVVAEACKVSGESLAQRRVVGECTANAGLEELAGWQLTLDVGQRALEEPVVAGRGYFRAGDAEGKRQGVMADASIGRVAWDEAAPQPHGVIGLPIAD